MVRRHRVENTHRDFTVPQQRVLKALEIDREAIESLPDKGIRNACLRYVYDTEVSPIEDP